MTERQKNDRDMCSIVWYLFRDFGDIQTGEDDRWKSAFDMADDAARKYPEMRKVFTEILGILEDRARGRA